MFNNSFSELSWTERVRLAHLAPIHRRNIVDDGFYSKMALGAQFTEGLEFPIIKEFDGFPDPTGAIPFSKMDRSKDHSECVVFFENDPLFADALLCVESFIDELRTFPCLATPDCSLYRDAPLIVQLSNIYLSRLFGSFCQRVGLSVIPTCRWGDERTYTDKLFAIPPAFDGLPKNGIYWVGTYGVSKRKEDKKHLRAGLEAMIKWLAPQKIFLYGSMPKDVFEGLDRCCEFALFRDWTTQVKGGANGKRK